MVVVLQPRQSEGFDLTIVEGDVSDFDAAAAMVKEVDAKLGPIDILINGAGITKDSLMQKMEKDQWDAVLRVNLDAVLRVNLDSVFNVTRQVIKGMIGRRFGRIINISSVNGQKGQIGQTNYSAAKAGNYSAAKAGMHGFTMALAQESARKNITVNTVSPGYIATSMVAAMGEKTVQKMIAQIPVGRLGTAEEIARLVTGANIAINGGMHTG